MPVPARAGISEVQHARPGGAHVLDAHHGAGGHGLQARFEQEFSVKGSPTCTVGRRSAACSSKTADAMVAPWMPSRPVLLPT